MLCEKANNCARNGSPVSTERCDKSSQEALAIAVGKDFTARKTCGTKKCKQANNKRKDSE